jgi:hypothetical protein
MGLNSVVFEQTGKSVYFPTIPTLVVPLDLFVTFSDMISTCGFVLEALVTPLLAAGEEISQMNDIFVPF